MSAAASLARTSRAMDDMKKSTRDLAYGFFELRSALGLFVGVLGGLAGITGFGDFLLKVDDMRVWRGQFAQLTGSVTEGGQVIRDMFAIARTTRTPVEDLTEATRKLLQTASASGATYRQATDALTAMSIAIKLGGTSVQGSQAALYQLSQALASGKARRRRVPLGDGERAEVHGRAGAGDRRAGRRAEGDGRRGPADGAGHPRRRRSDARKRWRTQFQGLPKGLRDYATEAGHPVHGRRRRAGLG